MKLNVFNLIILDESGSMESIKKPSLDGLNETLQTIQQAQVEHQEVQQHYVTLVSFNSSNVKTHFENCPASDIQTVKEKDYQPNSGTPLYDAMGTSITRLQAKLDEKELYRVLVTVITDGYENASKEYTGKMIKDLVQKLRNSGWIFTYIGANQDVDAVADSMAINNKLSFEATSDGYHSMMCKETKARKKMFANFSSNIFADGENYFEDKEEKPVANQPKKKKSIFSIIFDE
jgi:uncharacterized protein YegL